MVISFLEIAWVAFAKQPCCVVIEPDSTELDVHAVELRFFVVATYWVIDNSIFVVPSLVLLEISTAYSIIQLEALELGLLSSVEFRIVLVSSGTLDA
jgi:hypothetical protein